MVVSPGSRAGPESASGVADGSCPDWTPRAGLSEGDAHVIRNAGGVVTDDAFIPHTDQVRGFVYEVETGRLREVKA